MKREYLHYFLCGASSGVAAWSQRVSRCGRVDSHPSRNGRDLPGSSLRSRETRGRLGVGLVGPLRETEGRWNSGTFDRNRFWV